MEENFSVGTCICSGIAAAGISYKETQVAVGSAIAHYNDLVIYTCTCCKTRCRLQFCVIGNIVATYIATINLYGFGVV